MPIYEYQCVACGQVRDIKHGFKEPMNDACQACGGALRRLFNPASIVFKGSGFYVTDSRRAGAPAGEKAATDKSSDKPDGASKSDSTAKSDSATKSDSGSKSEPGSKSDSGGKGDSGKTDSGKSSSSGKDSSGGKSGAAA